MNSLFVSLLVHEEDDPFVIVYDSDVDEDNNKDDDSFVWTEEDEPFVVVAETLDSIMQKQNAENAHMKRSVLLVCTLILAYCMALVSLTTAVWATATTTPSFMKKMHEQENDNELYIIPPSCHPPVSSMIGYPIIDLSSRHQAYHELRVPDHADYAQKQAPSPAPTMTTTDYSLFQQVVSSPPKIIPVPFPSIAVPWKEQVTVMAHNETNTTTTTTTIHIPAPKARPVIIVDTPRRGTTRMLIPYAPTLHIPHWARTDLEELRRFNVTLPQAPAPTPFLMLFPAPQEQQYEHNKFVLPATTTLLTQYTFSDFFASVSDNNAVVIVAFYHPGLSFFPHDFLSTWQSFAEMVDFDNAQEDHTSILHAAVDCHAHPSVCREQGIAQFPTLRGYYWGTESIDFDEDENAYPSIGRSSKKLVTFARRLVSLQQQKQAKTDHYTINIPASPGLMMSSPTV